MPTYAIKYYLYLDTETPVESFEETFVVSPYVWEYLDEQLKAYFAAAGIHANDISLDFTDDDKTYDGHGTVMWYMKVDVEEPLANLNNPGIGVFQTARMGLDIVIQFVPPFVQIEGEDNNSGNRFHGNNNNNTVPVVAPAAAELATTAKPVNAPIQCFNPIEGTNGQIDPAGATFFVLNQDGSTAFAACLDAGSLTKYQTRKEYLFYRCKDTVPLSALFIRRHEDIHPTPIRLLNFQQRIYVLDSEAKALKPGKSYVCVPKENLGRIVSDEFLTTGQAVGAVHCGPADGSMLYELKEVSMAGGTRRRYRRATRRSRRGFRRATQRSRGRRTIRRRA